jgi:hypothetical protein
MAHGLNFAQVNAAAMKAMAANYGCPPRHAHVWGGGGGPPPPGGPSDIDKMLRQMASRGKSWDLAIEGSRILIDQDWEDIPAVITPPPEDVIMGGQDVLNLTTEGHNGTAFPQMEPAAGILPGDIFPEDWQHTGRTIF